MKFEAGWTKIAVQPSLLGTLCSHYRGIPAQKASRYSEHHRTCLWCFLVGREVIHQSPTHQQFTAEPTNIRSTLLTTACPKPLRT